MFVVRVRGNLAADPHLGTGKANPRPSNSAHWQGRRRLPPLASAYHHIDLAAAAASRSRQSSTRVSATYPAAISAGSGSLDAGNPCTTRSAGPWPRRRGRASSVGRARISSPRSPNTGAGRTDQIRLGGHRRGERLPLLIHAKSRSNPGRARSRTAHNQAATRFGIAWLTRRYKNPISLLPPLPAGIGRPCINGYDDGTAT